MWRLTGPLSGVPQNKAMQQTRGGLEAERGMVGGGSREYAVPGGHHRGARPSQLIASVLRLLEGGTRLLADVVAFRKVTLWLR